jgi:hypothetical protein
MITGASPTRPASPLLHKQTQHGPSPGSYACVPAKANPPAALAEHDLQMGEAYGSCPERAAPEPLHKTGLPALRGSSELWPASAVLCRAVGKASAIECHATAALQAVMRAPRRTSHRGCGGVGFAFPAKCPRHDSRETEAYHRCSRARRPGWLPNQTPGPRHRPMCGPEFVRLWAFSNQKPSAASTLSSASTWFAASKLCCVVQQRKT